MDFNAFPLVRPLNRLLYVALKEQMAAWNGSAYISFGFVEAFTSAAQCDYVPHGQILSMLDTRLRSDCSTSNGNGSLSGGNSGPAAIASLNVTRRLLQGLQWFPESEQALKASIEASIMLEHVIASAPSSEMGPVTFYQLWSILAQCSQWEMIEQVVRSFPMQETLHLQSDKEIQEIIGFVCASRHHVAESTTTTATASSAVPSASSLARPQGPLHSSLILRDVIGVEQAWQQCAKAFTHFAGGSSSSSSSSSAGDLRSKAAGNIVALSYVLKEWPTNLAPAEEAWRTPLDSLKLPGIFTLAQRALALQECTQIVPPYAQEALHAAVVTGIRRTCVEGLIDNIVMFHLYGAVSLARIYPDVDVTAALHELYNTALKVELAACSVSQMSVEALACISVSAACRRCDLADVVEPSCKAFVTALRNLLRSRCGEAGASASKAFAAVTESNVPDCVEQVWQSWPAMRCAYIAIIAECLLPLQSSTTFSVSSTQALVEEMCELCRIMLPESLLVSRGTARCVAMLLLHAPRITRELGLEATCVELVKANADKGFTHQQLASLASTRGDVLDEVIQQELMKQAETIPLRIL